jgi:hypothetical protein
MEEINYLYFVFVLCMCMYVCVCCAGRFRSKYEEFKKLATPTPVSTKRKNRVASKKPTSGIDKKKILSDLISMGLKGKHTEQSDQNSTKKFSVLAGLCYNQARTV